MKIRLDLLAFLSIIVFAVFIAYAFKNFAPNTPNLSPIPTPLPTNTPTPTPLPTPTPVPLVGYCLKVPVLLYHHVQPQQQAVEKKQTSMSVDNEMFDKQMEYLVTQGYSFLTAKELVDALKNKSPLPTKSIVLTFDDGYRDNFEYAFPIIKKYNIKTNFMIATGLLEGADYMSWNNLDEMSASGLVYWTNHTWSHYNIASGNTEKIKYEVSTGKEQLQSRFGQEVNIFTYPYGLFGSHSIQILTEMGTIGAFSTIPGHWQCDSFIMALHRNRVGNSSMSSYGL